MQEAVAELRAGIGPDETWRMSVERRAATTRLDPKELVRALAELIARLSAPTSPIAGRA